VVHVAAEDAIEGSSVMNAQKTRKEIKARLEEICTRFQSAGIAARSHVYVGRPAEEIEKAAQECQATMVVLGSSSKNRWWSAGSAARLGRSPNNRRSPPS